MQVDFGPFVLIDQEFGAHQVVVVIRDRALVLNSSVCSKNFDEEVVRVNNQSIKREITGDVEYRVQIGAFKEEDIPEDVMRIYLQFDDINENIQKELTILTLGEYGDYDIAKAFCSNIQELGIPDAFVVAFNQGRKITIEEASEYLTRKREGEVEKAREDAAAEQEDEKKKKKRK